MRCCGTQNERRRKPLTERENQQRHTHDVSQLLSFRRVKGRQTGSVSLTSINRGCRYCYLRWLTNDPCRRRSGWPRSTTLSVASGALANAMRRLARLSIATAMWHCRRLFDGWMLDFCESSDKRVCMRTAHTADTVRVAVSICSNEWPSSLAPIDEETRTTALKSKR